MDSSYMNPNASVLRSAWVRRFPVSGSLARIRVVSRSFAASRWPRLASFLGQFEPDELLRTLPALEKRSYRGYEHKRKNLLKYSGHARPRSKNGVKKSVLLDRWSSVVRSGVL